MTTADAITTFFQTGASIFLCLNILQLKRDRELRGVSIWTIAFFTVWSYWGIFLFYSLDLFWSMVSNAVMAVAYTVWLALAVRVRTCS